MEESEGAALISEGSPEKTSGSKMLKKAQSFREDIKNKIRRRPSTGVQQMIPDGKGNRKSKGDVTPGEGRSGDDDLDQLKAAMSEVNKTLIFIKAVVSKGKTEVLPGSASVILETVMHIFTLLRYPLLAQESNSLSSSQSKVCQNLAKFIQWTDDSLVGESKDGCDKERAQDIIDTLLEGIKELTQLGMEKMSQRKSSSMLQTPITSQPLPSPPASADGSSDIPLSSREQEILAQTGGCAYDNLSAASGQRGSNASSVFSFDSSSSTADSADMPPPKPPLPQGSNPVLNRLTSSDQDSVDGGQDLVPPPLPEKKRSPSTSLDILDSVSGRASTCSTPSGATPSTSTHPSSLVSSASLDHQLGIAGRGSLASLPGNTLVSGGIVPGAATNGGSPVNHLSLGDVSISQSSSSSSSSSLQATQSWQQQKDSEGGPSTTTTTHTFSRTVSDSKLVSSTVVSRKATTGGKACDEINQLTSQIKKLTHCIEDTPPPLPAKKGSGLHRLNSQYDNVPDGLEDRVAALTSVGSSVTMSQQRTVVMRKMESRISSSSTSSSQSNHSNQSQSITSVNSHKSMQSYLTEQSAGSHETFSSSETFSSASHSSTESLPKPPPLPPKKKHVQAYMRTFGALTQPGLLEEAISRHSITFYEAQWHQHQRELFYPRSNTISVFSDISSGSSVSGGGSSERINSMPPLPIKINRLSDISHGSQLSTGSSQSSSSAGDLLSLDKSTAADSVSVASQPQRLSLPQPVAARPPPEVKEVAPLAQPEIQKDSDSDFCELNLLDDLDISDQLILKQEGEEGPEVRGGAVDALIVHATQAGKIGSEGDVTEQEEFMFQEAFLTTYRMFISPKALMEKLLYRFHKFQHAVDHKKKLAHNAFSLLIRVVDELGCNELDSTIVDRLMTLVYDLICEGALNLARLLRRKLLEKCEQKQTEIAEVQAALAAPVQSIELGSSTGDLLSFKAHDIAEQMTLLDAQLFQKIEIPEVLMWAREQSEELSPHLTTFTEHFNKMSYWCCTRILTQDDPRERERYLMKFIKIMRHLRKLHNFNSYLAILSALNSAPVHRLEWQKQNVEVLQELCQLIDSSSSFRVYRQTLSETPPPCIPYLGLILQDLTFINIGNQDKLPEGSINFAKHWQQFNILDSMRRFRTSCYQFKRSEKIMGVLNNFKDHLSEEVLWQISQKIKPSQTGHKKQNSVS
ncbi:rap guanine nucleotide exchange factor 1 [Aplysia californica]|uniref:Rap guanine nucleotide exchange factor 1 n=1 Tax=Aplysia californica TaxID=6500 RepID=A0ABM1ADF1_APLCA|nr:rap guanine nucleotide exchange factor 1 [Aplysia californica]